MLPPTHFPLTHRHTWSCLMLVYLHSAAGFISLHHPSQWHAMFGLGLLLAAAGGRLMEDHEKLA